jgi:outer membrane protein OmpA-like peptidoglycan-associated protein
MPLKKPAVVVSDAKQAPAAAAASAPPLPEHSPRFETAALPPGNIGPEADCIGAVRAAAQPVEVHFAHGLARLDKAGKALIDRLIGALNTCPEATLNVAGHSDGSGHPRRNLVLSKRRARTATSYMIHKGIDAGRLVAIGYGDKRPVAPNDTQANRAKNRRIEVAITARAAPLPPLPVRKQGTEHGLSRR